MQDIASPKYVLHTVSLALSGFAFSHETHFSGDDRIFVFEGFANCFGINNLVTPPLLTHHQALLQQIAPTRADLMSDPTSLSLFLLVIGTVTILSLLRWRGWGNRRKSKKQARSTMEKSTVEIEAVARKLQQRLPENRVVRDRGSTIVPRNRSKPIEAYSPGLFESPRPANLSKILVIEESRDYRMSLTNLLHRYYSMLESDNLDEALRIARIARPSLIILGMHSSKKQGMAFCRKLKSDSTLWHIPVLVLLSKKSTQEATHLIKATDDYLLLPLQSAELLVAVENMVDVRRYLKQGGLKRPNINADDSTTQISDGMFLEAVHTVVENNLSNRLFGLETLAQEVNVTVKQLHGRLRKLTRLSPAGFIRTKRLHQAASILQNEHISTQELAQRVGFHSSEHFTRVFKQAFGMMPSEFGSTY